MSKITVRRFVGSMVAILMGIALFQLSGLEAQAAKGKKEVRVEGKLVNVDLTTGVLTIQTKAGNVFVGVNSATKIERNGFKATLAQFKLNDFTQARFATAITEPALKVEAKGP
jgi:hypothetical protein